MPAAIMPFYTPSAPLGLQPIGVRKPRQQERKPLTRVFRVLRVFSAIQTHSAILTFTAFSVMQKSHPKPIINPLSSTPKKTPSPPTPQDIILAIRFNVQKTRSRTRQKNRHLLVFTRFYLFFQKRYEPIPQRTPGHIPNCVKIMTKKQVTVTKTSFVVAQFIAPLTARSRAIHRAAYINH